MVSPEVVQLTVSCFTEYASMPLATQLDFRRLSDSSPEASEDELPLIRPRNDADACTFADNDIAVDRSWLAMNRWDFGAFRLSSCAENSRSARPAAYALKRRSLRS